MALAEYRKKRDFHRTPEPVGKRSSPASGRLFVVQRHAARRLHYDFRLELDGVLKSWAVPKGPSLDPAVKSLAVEVEDHPLEYGGFEGTIPAGEYGGGTVMLFDRGSWQPLGDAQKDLHSGKLKFRLQGQRLQGDWLLVRSSRQRDRQTQWLLRKLDDDQARPDEEHQYVRQFAHSVETGRSMEQIAAAADRVWSSDQGEQKVPPTRKAKSAPSRSETPAAAPEKPADLPGARRRGIPEFVEPQLPTLVDRPPAGDGWLHELKLDGYRLIAVKSGDHVRLLTRRGNEWTDRSPAVVEAIGRLGPQRLVLDGEVVIVQPDGTTDFQALQNSLRQGRFKDHVYFAFDLLYCDGYDLTPCPLEARKQFLHTLLADRGGDAQTVRFSDYVRGQGDAMFQHACRFAVEGLVSKQVDGRYVSGRSRQWLKSKCLLRQEFVVVGFTRPQGTRLHFGALLLGYYDAQQRLVYCGRVGTGFTAESLAELSDELRRRTIDQRPVKVVPADADTRGVTWVRPELVAEVEFAQWTKEGVLRQASFQGLREDKDPREVVRELPAAGRRRGTAPPARRGSARQAASSRGGPSRRSVKPSTRRSEKSSGRGGVRVAGVLLSHPEKILYPEQRVAKVDLASYYERVAPWILPQLAGRPLSLVRCPEGHNQDCFYQKTRCREHAGDDPERRGTREIGNQAICDDRGPPGAGGTRATGRARDPPVGMQEGSDRSARSAGDRFGPGSRSRLGRRGRSGSSGAGRPGKGKPEKLCTNDRRQGAARRGAAGPPERLERGQAIRPHARRTACRTLARALRRHFGPRQANREDLRGLSAERSRGHGHRFLFHSSAAGRHRGHARDVGRADAGASSGRLSHWNRARTASPPVERSLGRSVRIATVAQRSTTIRCGTVMEEELQPVSSLARGRPCSRGAHGGRPGWRRRGQRAPSEAVRVVALSWSGAPGLRQWLADGRFWGLFAERLSACRRLGRQWHGSCERCTTFDSAVGSRAIFLGRRKKWQRTI
jgi:bifunctional non-homologous end joining protein LigD